ncbi:tripartite motif-containing protein 16-like [Anoplopoma fimbria]|uniref:tripartite motif-containing protein 16-like n=1 Tax=Anoplopoma fimbria TaxID=229290 RepID=UPI0023EB08B0|nr:tripartite motif-containing protein 16-like [Anoplopoma fimbria]XP_054480748.1 tripartite motif-containing protein 16-like [Anoplopoma fimbria]
MASASSLLCDEQLLCSICLSVFTEPVSTPCGHNYCKTCITGYWASRNQIQCPLCMKKFRRRPQLQVNTGFRDIVEHFHKKGEKDQDGILVKPGEVSCDICLVPKLKAQKTCLVCLASYCQLHLEPHQRVPTLKKHQLMDPVSNLDDRVCKKHDKMLELFCRKEQMCVCFMCLKDDHAMHEVVPLEHVFRERKVQLDCVTSEMKMKENTKSRTIKELKYSIDQSKKESEKELVDIAEVFTALVVSWRRNQVELIKEIQKKQKVAQKQAEDHVTQLELEVAEMRRRRSEMEQLSQTEDHLHLLQSWPSLYLFDHQSHSNPPFTSDLTDFSQRSEVAKVKKAVAQMEKTLSNEMEMLINMVKLPDAAENQMPEWFPREVWTPPRDKLMMIQQNDAIDVTLDAYTANSKLMVSEDGKQLTLRNGLPSLTTMFGRRFQLQAFVLGKEGFSSGRFYYEVQVSGSKQWLLGVAKESVNRENLFIPVPCFGCWTYFGSHIHSLNFNPDTGMNAPLQRTQKVGVFVDYEKGEVSFYDVEARTLMHSYSECAFIETIPAFKAFLYFLVGASSNSRPKLYPFFGLYEDDFENTLVITPVVHPT